MEVQRFIEIPGGVLQGVCFRAVRVSARVCRKASGLSGARTEAAARWRPLHRLSGGYSVGVKLRSPHLPAWSTQQAGALPRPVVTNPEICPRTMGMISVSVPPLSGLHKTARFHSRKETICQFCVLSGVKRNVHE